MNRTKITAKGLKRLKYFNRTALAAIAALALGLWTPQMASATLIAEIEPNDTGATAQNVNGNFSLDADPNITDSTTLPHVSIRAGGDGTFDFYRFTSAGGRIILDIDDTTSVPDVLCCNDTEIGIWNAGGTLMGTNDDMTPPLDPGTLSPFNSFLDLSSMAAGDYIVGVCAFDCVFSSGFDMTGAAMIGPYTLHISTAIETVPTPEPSSMLLLGSALAGLGAYSRRRNAKKS